MCVLINYYKSLLEIVSLVAENSSIPNDVGNLPLFLTYLSLEILSKILFTELVENIISFSNVREHLLYFIF